MRQRSALPLFSTRLTATISVALVLLILGATALLGIGAHNVATDLRQHMGFVMMLNDDATAADITAMKKRFARESYVASYAYASPEEVMARWQQLLGDEENLAELMDGVNPFAPEFEVHVKTLWANPDSLTALAERLEMLPGVERVNVHTEMVNTVHTALNRVYLTSAIIAALLLVISFVLINNTVRLTVYSRRFLIYTMKLVGATGGFIRRPIVSANTLAGFIAGAVAAAILAGLLAWGRDLDPAIAMTVDWPQAGIVFGAMAVAGALLCFVASTLATNKYLRRSHDDMYR